MGLYLTIPDVVDSEELLSLQRLSQDTEFELSMYQNNTAVFLFGVAGDGERIPLVVLTTNAQIIALDDVYVSNVSASASSSVFAATLNAGAVRFV